MPTDAGTEPRDSFHDVGAPHQHCDTLVRLPQVAEAVSQTGEHKGEVVEHGKIIGPGDQQLLQLRNGPRPGDKPVLKRGEEVQGFADGVEGSGKVNRYALLSE